MCNSNGVAVDPKARIYPYGGEVQTPPTWTIEGQADYLDLFLKMHPNTTINYRSNLHVHIRVPGLRDDLDGLKQLCAFNHKWLRQERLLDLIEPIPKPSAFDYDTMAELKGALKRYKRRKRSHHTTLSESKVQSQLAATTVRNFFEAEVPHGPNGEIYWATQPRAAVNLRQLLQTDTIEFRHWPGTLDRNELTSAFEWCYGYLQLALGSGAADPRELWQALQVTRQFPQFLPYVHWMEERYDRTCIEKVGITAAQQAVKEILSEH
jgi:hypothetical protein